MVWIDPNEIVPPHDEEFGGSRTCGNCLRHCEIGEEDFVVCTAAFEDNPIWAERRRRGRQLRKTILERQDWYIGIDPEAMRRDDGVQCEAFIEGGHNAG